VRIVRYEEGSVTIPAARVLAFPGIDLDTLAKIRARACDAFLREDIAAYQDACMMIRKLIGGQDVSETGSRSYHHRKMNRRRGEPPAQGTQHQPSANIANRR
jgi:hypothetical protein